MSLPAAVRLKFDCDRDELAAELTHVPEKAWRPKDSFEGLAQAEAESQAWQAVALRSQGGDPLRTDPGGPGTAPYALTPIAEELPYLRHLIDLIPAEVRSARLILLSPGGVSPVHKDDVGWDCGLVRLHIPVSTNDGASVWIDGSHYRWDVGELWYGDFGRDHYVTNEGASSRVHLVIDALPSTELLELFPAAYRASFPYAEASFARKPVPLGPDELATFRSAFRVPRADYVFEDELWSAGEPDNCEADVDNIDDTLVMSFSPGGRYALMHVGGGEFRMEGWTELHTVRIVRGEIEPLITFIYRRGRAFGEYTVRGTYLP